MNPGDTDLTKLFQDKRILITGGTGSLGKVLTRRLLSGEFGRPARIIIFSRDEGKQHNMRLNFHELRAATEEVIFHDFEDILDFRIGDVRDFHSLAGTLPHADIVFNTAALKQVPTCEYFPWQATRTNIEGAENIVRCIDELRLPVETVVGISTDKAAKPVNVMGMTKAIQERIFMNANMRCPGTRFVGVRYGNVLASRGSVIPLFHSQIRSGGPVTITTTDMTRFLLSLDQAVDTIVHAYRDGQPGEIFIPRIAASLITNIAEALIDGRDIEVKVTGIRPGEKIHEILVSEEEAMRTVERGDYYAIRSILPEVCGDTDEPIALTGEYSSASCVMDLEATRALLRRNRLMIEDVTNFDELLR